MSADIIPFPSRARPAKSVVCPGCERACAMAVHTVSRADGKAASFVVCDKRDDINRVAIPDDLLKQQSAATPASKRLFRVTVIKKGGQRIVTRAATHLASVDLLLAALHQHPDAMRVSVIKENP